MQQQNFFIYFLLEKFGKTVSYAVIFLNDIVYWNLDESWHMVKEIFLWHIKNLGKEFGDHYSCKRKYKGNSMYISHWLDAKCPIWWVEVIHEKNSLDFHCMYFYMTMLQWCSSPPTLNLHSASLMNSSLLCELSD